MDYIHTPAQTYESTFMTNAGGRLEDVSPEKSFHVPSQGGDLVSQMRSAKLHSGANLKTPRAGTRDPLRLLPNVNQGRSEFTPFLKSGTKNNIARRLSSRKQPASNTPSYLNGRTPALPRLSDLSRLEGEYTSSSAGRAVDDTPIPHHPSSSVKSTPLAQLPTRDGGGLVNDGNMMTLREQEGIIDKIEKENFGLKMKIHFLEEALSKRGNEFNQAALKENTDLKVNRITMQRELHKFKKNIAQAEKDAEVYRLQLEEFKERIRRKQFDENVRHELETLRSELREKDEEIKALAEERDHVASQDRSEVQKLRDEIEDLQADLREKERIADEREDQIDELKMKASKESNSAAEIEEDLESAKQEIEDLKQSLDRAKEDLNEAQEEKEEALEEKRKAEQDLDELRDEMANKSFTTKGLSRQLEEKANKLEDDFQILQEQHDALQAEMNEKTESERQLRDRVRELEREGASDLRKLQQEVELSHQQRDTLERKLANTTKHLETVERELQIKVEEKDLLQTRHDALTRESAELQKDLNQLQNANAELENALEEERQVSARKENDLLSRHRNEIDLLNEQIDGLHREVNAKANDHAADLEDWESQRKTLEAASQKAEERARGLQRTVDKLQDAQGTLSGREMRLQEAIESEKERHRQEEMILSKQIEELQQDLRSKRNLADDSRTELNNAKEELRISIREQAALKEKVAELEEEIEVLQADIEQEHEFAERQQQKYSTSADAQVQKLQREKQALQEQLTNSNVELHGARTALRSAEQEREKLEAAVQRVQKPYDDTFNVDHEKRELKRLKVKLEADVARLTTERDNLAEANNALEDEINAELERASKEEVRLHSELDNLRSQKSSAWETRDRELSNSKAKIIRLEARIKDLESLLDNQTKVVNSPHADLTGLTRDLADARKNETAIAKREVELKSANRELKIRINDLERELHESKLAQYKAKSPSLSPPPPHSKEIAKIRQDLVDAQAEVKVLSSENRELRRTTRRNGTDVEELVSLRSRAEEIEALELKIAEQNDLIDELRDQLDRLQEEDRDGVSGGGPSRRDRQVDELKAQVKRLREEQESSVHDLSMRLSVRSGEAREMKQQLRRLREERTRANQKAETVENELEVLQNKYESMLERLSSGKSLVKDEVRQKEVRGLIKEVIWLKAKCRREERLRKDLAWSKAFLEQGEAMRVQCNQVDLRILNEMGVSVDKAKYETRLRPVQKFRAGVFAVMAAIRMSNLEEQWRDARIIGDEVKLIRAKQASRTRSRGLGGKVLEV
ncbi:hypothetical protein PV08_10323 [Exophiala spinifera]|uniref:Centrosomin N-terminal motif 1 domain-containing protein n=1 Tax=Exophiala spinifera TaxID=91928 RepID=A0A0D2BI66_9EURO|nr:uncharacterized protein PV08_10323 [Exophiala spinifera]KIW11024.1 hypothetical protein PV08_10323 [Exophiala spinifera]